MTRPPLEAWGLTGTAAPLPGGNRNAVLRVGEYALKSTRRSEAAIAWLLPVMDIAQACGIQTARPIRSTSGTLVADGWTCEPFLPGTPADPRCLNEQIATFHARTTSVPQRPGFASSTALLVQTSGGDVDLGGMPFALVSALRDAWADLPATAPCVIHGDLNPSNLLQTARGQITLTDWDEARIDHPAFDTVQTGSRNPISCRAAVAWEIACCWHIEHERAARLAISFLAQS